MKTLDRFTYGLIGQYGDRKKPGRLSVFIDLNNQPALIYPVTRDIEHVDLARKLYEGQPEKLARLIPVHIDLHAPLGIEQVVGLLTGECGMEALLSIKHTRKDLETAHTLAQHFIANGEINTAENQMIAGTISRRYAAAS